MTEDKNSKRFWIKLEKDFLNSKFIKIIKAMDNGTEYILFYLALMLESVDTVGHLRLSELVPYNEKTLAALTDINIDVVRSALKIFAELGMVLILNNGTIFLPEVSRLTGKECESAERVRRYRQKQEQNLLALQCNDDVTACNGHVTNCNDNIEKSREEEEKNREEEDSLSSETDKDVELKPIVILNLYNSICTSLPRATKMTNKRHKSINALKGMFKADEIEEGFRKAQSNSFLNGGGPKNWKADFDWLINRNNLLKVLEGRYDHNNATSKTEASYLEGVRRV